MYLQKALTIILPQSKNSLRGGECTERMVHFSYNLHRTLTTLKTVQQISQRIRVWKYPWPMDLETSFHGSNTTAA